MDDHPKRRPNVRLSSLARSINAIIVLGLAIAVWIGYFAAPHYGEGWDEHQVATDARESLNAFSAGDRAYQDSSRWDVTGPTGPDRAMGWS